MALIAVEARKFYLETKKLLEKKSGKEAKREFFFPELFLKLKKILSEN